MTDFNYSYLRAAWKFLAALIAVLSPQVVLEMLPEDPATFSNTWPVYACALVIAAARVVMNALKNQDLDGNPITLLKASLQSDTRGAVFTPTLPALLLATILPLLVGSAASIALMGIS